MQGTLKLFFLLFIFSNTYLAQDYIIFNNDTINRYNELDRKVGKWANFSQNSLGKQVIVSEGNFWNDKKIGKWTYYNFLGNKAKVLTYVNGKIEGEIIVYNEKEEIIESGRWSENKWKGLFISYYAGNKKKQEFNFNESGLKNGNQFYYYPNGNLALKFTFFSGKKHGKFLYYNLNEEICKEEDYANDILTKAQGDYLCPNYSLVVDSILKSEPAGRSQRNRLKFETRFFDDRELAEEGYYLDNVLINGKKLVRNKSGQLMKIEVYKDGFFERFELNIGPSETDKILVKNSDEKNKEDAYLSELFKQNEDEELYRILNKIVNQVTEKQIEILNKDKEIEKSSLENSLLLKEQQIREFILAQNKNEIAKQHFENEKKKFEISELNKDKIIRDNILRTEKLENETRKAEIEKQKIVTNSFFIGIILLSFLSFFVIRSYYIKRKSNTELLAKNKLIEEQKQFVEEKNSLIEEKNKEITDSINYAQKIQHTLIASDKLLDDNLRSGIQNRDYFILYKPKDIVSGDYYWGYRPENENSFIFITADCTGHGVPGAFMSLLCISYLNEVVKEQGITKPDVIFNLVRDKIVANFSVNKNSERKDGMDAVIYKINFDTNILEYAAANNPIVLLEPANGVYELIELKADKMPVGVTHDGVYKPFSFGEHKLKSNTIIYTFTDGYADQFGGPKGKKFMYKRMRELFRDLVHLSASEQKEKLDSAINLWKGESEQVDDILIIGVKV